MQVAAIMNPAMSSWVALRRRVPLQVGQSVLILGATGNAGQMAVQIAKHLGAARVVGAGRDRERLEVVAAMGADDVVQLTETPSRQQPRWPRLARTSTSCSTTSGAHRRSTR